MIEPCGSRQHLLLEAFVGPADTLVDDYDVIDTRSQVVPAHVPVPEQLT